MLCFRWQLLSTFTIIGVHEGLAKAESLPNGACPTFPQFRPHARRSGSEPSGVPGARRAKFEAESCQTRR